MERRTILQAAASATAGLLAGCSGGGNDGPTDTATDAAGPTDTATDVATASPTATATDSPTSTATATPTETPTPTPIPIQTEPNNDIFARQTEQFVFETFNNQRQSVGLKPLEWNDKLHQIAVDHSQDMAEEGYVGHGRGVEERYADYGYECDVEHDFEYYSGGGEMLHRTFYDKTISVSYKSGDVTYKSSQELASGIMASLRHDDHYSNYINKQFWSEMGVGVYVNLDTLEVLTSIDLC